MTKPFLLLQIRPEDAASNGEYNAILKFSGLSENEIHRVRMEQTGFPDVNLDDYSAVIIGGGPWNPSDPIEKKSAIQIDVEKKLEPFCRDLVAKDFPCLAICYGLEILVKSLGVNLTHDYHEKPGAIDLILSDAGVIDPLLADLPKTFRVFVGHKEAASRVPDGGILLASSVDCPVHLFRQGKNIYATQFHPELDVEFMLERTEVYKHLGYFPVADAEKILDAIRHEHITEPMKFLRKFIEAYRS